MNSVSQVSDGRRRAIYYVTILLIGLFCILDLYPLAFAIHDKQKQCQHLRQQLMLLNQKEHLSFANSASHQISPRQNQMQYPLSIWLGFMAQQSGATVVQIQKRAPDHAVFSQAWSCRVSGRDDEIQQFIHLLTQQEERFVMMDFTLARLASGRVQLDVKLSVVGEGNVLMKDALSLTVPSAHEDKTPFCTGVPLSSVVNDEKQLKTVSINALRYVGFIQQGQVTIAWLQLPNESLVTVHERQVIGYEQARVLRVTPDRLWLQTDSGRRVIIEGAGLMSQSRKA